MNGHGGTRNGAGRKAGRPDARTSKVRDCYQAEMGARLIDAKRLGDESAAVAYFVGKRLELYDKALAEEDGLKVAVQIIEGLEDRCFGKPRQQLELAGDQDNPLAFQIPPGFYRCQFADGAETPSSAAAAGSRESLPKKGKRGKSRKRV